MEAVAEKLTFEHLAGISILSDAPKGALKAAAKAAEWIVLRGGKELFQPGNSADHIYFVKSGVLGAFSRGSDGKLEMLGYIRSGEPVGEMAFLSAAPHSSHVYAMRDAELIKVTRASFDKLVKRYPSLLRSLSQMMVVRMRSNRRSSPQDRSQPKVFALLSSSPTINGKHLAGQLSDALADMGKSVMIVGPGAVNSSLDWFDEQERTHDLVIMHGPIADNSWFRMCLRQADRLWILGRADAVPSDPLLPSDDSPARAMRLIDVIVLHNQGERTASTGADWKRAANASRVFHWTNANKEDVARLARTAAGNSVGLVLSGGGARAYAHIGAIRALREANIPIDFCGGTSMGAIIAANLALGWDDERIESSIVDAFVRSNPVDDYILPVVALTKGAKVKRRLANYYGDSLIENMVLPFFCLSSNLSTGRSSIHRSGDLKTALAASISLPGILPPIVINNEVHVDGAVLNNFPVNVMQDFHRGPVLGIDVSRARGLLAEPYINPPGFFSWVLEHGFHSAPPIAGLLMRSATLPTSDLSVRRAEADILIVPEMGDVDVRDWKSFDKATEAGYVAMVQAIENGQLDVLR